MLSPQRLALTFLAVASLNGPAFAQDYPNRPITLMVPLAAGGGMDFMARTVGAKLSERLGKPVLVENRPGGGTVVAAVALAKAAPDGHTLLLAPANTITTNTVVYKTLPYDPRKDFVPIALTSQVAFTLVVNPALPIQSVTDLIKFGKDKPGELISGTSGIVTTTHLAGELLAHMTGITIRHTHYRGSPPALNDVMSGTVHMMFADPVTGTQLAKAGKVRALAVSSKTRLSVYPELLPIAEAGVPGYEATNWHMLLAPANTPKEVVERLSSEVRAILATPEVRDQIIKIGLEPQISPPPAALPQVIEADVARWGPIVQQTGLAGSM